MKDNAVYEPLKELDISDDCNDVLIKDEIVTVDTIDADMDEQRLRLLRFAYWDLTENTVNIG